MLSMIFIGVCNHLLYLIGAPLKQKNGNYVKCIFLFFLSVVGIDFNFSILEARIKNCRFKENVIEESSLSIEPLFSDFVGEVREVDLREDFSLNDISKLNKALKSFCVLVFKNQIIDRNHLLQLANIFGIPGGCQDITNLDTDPNSLEFRLRKGNEVWHMDMPILDAPPLASILYAVEIPKTGGDTQFIDLSRALQDLPTIWLDRLKNKYAIYDLEMIHRRIGITDLNEIKSIYPSNRHPMICSDPFSGKPCLMISSHLSFIEGIELDLNENQDNILAELFSYITKEPYTHKWEVGDVVFWNNRRCLHRVLPFADLVDRRRLYRVEVLGGLRPVEHEK